jgi:hypothetical protein
VLLTFVSIALALGFQYGIAPFLVDSSYTGWLRDGWLDGCEEYQFDEALQESCAGIYAVYRVGFATTLFFVLAAIAVLCKPTANREAWPAKYVLWVFLCAAMIFIPNEPLFSKVYLNIARVGAILFVGLQQLIIVDMAYDWNESWVAKADAAEAEEIGSGKKWLYAILASCAILFTVSIVSIILIIINFTGCPTNDAFVAITLVLGVAITLAQLTGQEGSLLASASVFTWAVFLCYTAVTKNPDAECNPKLGEPDNISIVLGICVTMISLCWTGWSYTAEDKMNWSEDDGAEEPLVDSGNKKEEREVTGIVTGGNYGNEGEEESPATVDADEAAMSDPKRLSNSWKLNIILATIACWQSMVLTNFGEISADGTAANPQVGRAGMWVIISSQWLALSLYLWTLVAPKLLPGREFG